MYVIVTVMLVRAVADAIFIVEAKDIVIMRKYHDPDWIIISAFKFCFLEIFPIVFILLVIKFKSGSNTSQSPNRSPEAEL
jgi:hypothetical protein